MSDHAPRNVISERISAHPLKAKIFAGVRLQHDPGMLASRPFEDFLRDHKTLDLFHLRLSRVALHRYAVTKTRLRSTCPCKSVSTFTIVASTTRSRGVHTDQ